MQHNTSSDHHPNQNLEMSLREHLSHLEGSGGPPPYPSTSGPPPPSGQHQYPPAEPGSPHEQYDHNAAGQPSYNMGADGNPNDESPGADGRNKGKRELSTSKRAAQNRAAQRAFRQRKEGYIKKLEEQVKEYETLEQGFRGLQEENYRLREYILSLQSRLLENQSDIPPPPAETNLGGPNGPGPERGERSSAVDQQLRREMDNPPLRHDAMSQLQAAAAQASDAQAAEGSYPAGPDPGHHRARADDPAVDTKTG